MQVYIGLDDTDILGAPCGTGKLARRLAECLPEDCRVEGVLRQQHLVADAVPYTAPPYRFCDRAGALFTAVASTQNQLLFLHPSTLNRLKRPSVRDRQRRHGIGCGLDIRPVVYPI
jgi:hypothetical protein